MNRKALIYDIETLSTNPVNAAIVSMAAIVFEMKSLERGEYDYESLVELANSQKYNVEDQVKNYKRQIDPETLDWWKQQGKEAIKRIKPSDEDVSITEAMRLLTSLVVENNIDFVFTRNNSFDPVIIRSISDQTGIPMPYGWWKLRDTKSFILGLTYEMDIRDDFIPPGLENKFIKHDPRHDIAMDVMRMQTILTAKMSD